MRAEPVTTPLGLPDTLVHLIDVTLEQVFATLENPLRHHPAHVNGTTSEEPICPCGRNPLLVYFVAGDQAMREGLILAQAASAPLDPVERDASLEELNAVIRRISRREIEAICGVCQFRHLALPAPVESLAIS